MFSVGGSLASYHVQKEGEEYRAVLRTNNGYREDIPAEIKLVKNNANWQAEPWNDEVVKGLVLAIEHHLP